jgi:hypothetical protein
VRRVVGCGGSEGSGRWFYRFMEENSDGGIIKRRSLVLEEPVKEKESDGGREKK